MGEPAREVAPRRQKQRNVVEARVAARRPCTGLLDEPHELAVGAERRRPAVVLEHLQADDALPVLERAPEIGDGQLDRAHVHELDYPCACLSCASFRCASASASAPEQTRAFRSFSIRSTSLARG